MRRGGAFGGEVRTKTRAFTRRAGTFCLSVLLLVKGPAGLPQTGKAVSADIQVPLLLKALTYDRTLGEKARGDILVGILYKPDDAESEAVARSVAKHIAATSMQTGTDLPVYYRMIPYRDELDLGNIIREEWVDVLYLSPALDEFLQNVLPITAEAKVLSVTGVPEYVGLGVSMGVEEQGGRAGMIVNLASAESEGSRFAGQFLSLCRVIREDPADSVSSTESIGPSQ